MTRRRLDPGDDFHRLFASGRRSSWRWECQGYYRVDEVALQRWRDGHPLREDNEDRQWRAYIAGLRARGVPFERVRVFNEPPTEYQRWMLAVTDWSVAIGEDVRWVSASQVRGLSMPDYDFYLFDEDRVVILLFDETKTLVGEYLIDDADVVQQHRAYRAAAWARAIPQHDYVRDLDGQ